MFQPWYTLRAPPTGEGDGGGAGAASAVVDTADVLEETGAGEDAGGEKVGEKAAGDVAELKGQVKQLRKDLDETKTKAEEAETASAYWYGQAQGKGGGDDDPEAGGGNKAAATDTDDDEPFDEATLKGLKKVVPKLAKEMGYISREEFDTLADARINRAVKDNGVRSRYPGLNDKSSEMFKVTSAHYADLKAQGVPEALLLEQSAEKAELELRRTGKWQDAGEAEAERLARVGAQNGSQPGGGSADSADDKTLTAQQKLFAKRLGVSEEAYVKRAEQGVQMAGPRPS